MSSVIQLLSSYANEEAPTNEWTYEQLFDGLSNGDLNGQDSWSGSATYDVESTVFYQGSKAVQKVLTSSDTITRSFTGIGSGSVYFAMRMSSDSATSSYVILGNDADGALMYLRMHNDNNFGAYNGSSYVTITTWVVDTWYVINIEFDEAAHPGQWRARVHSGGSWGAFIAWQNTTNLFSTVEWIRFDNDGTDGSSAYWDTITPNDPT